MKATRAPPRPPLMTMLSFWLSEWLFEARRFASRLLRPRARPVELCEPLSFIAQAEAFALADPRSGSLCPPGLDPERQSLAARAGALLRSSSQDLCQAALALDQEALQEAPFGARGVSSAREAMGGLLALQERQRRALAIEREALCLLAFHCARLIPAPALGPSRRDPDLDAPQRLLNGLTLLSFFVGSRHVELCALLLELGADPEAPDDRGQAPLDLAEIKARALEGGAGRAQAACLQARELASLLQSAALDKASASGPARPPKAGARRL